MEFDFLAATSPSCKTLAASEDQEHTFKIEK